MHTTLNRNMVLKKKVDILQLYPEEERFQNDIRKLLFLTLWKIELKNWIFALMTTLL